MALPRLEGTASYQRLSWYASHAHCFMALPRLEGTARNVHSHYLYLS